ncbi:MAG: hypothetical protein LUE98_04630 [Tannerellaceae bacterium]|nr:hypothetical protein [Tannerellaceae bacterium]
MGTKPFYLNPGQRYLYEMMPQNADLIGARRLGKTTGVAAPYLHRIVSYMPGGRSFIYCQSFKQGLTRTIPSTITALENMTGLKEGIHFYLGSKAPKSAGFGMPLTKTYDWEHCIHWYNGHVTFILSQDVKLSANSHSFDAGYVDEAKGTKKENIENELILTMSGTPGMFEDFPLKKGMWMFSDRPLTREGLWILDHERLATPNIKDELEEAIRAHALMTNEAWPKWMIQKELEHINHLRQKCHLYLEMDTIENVEVVGVDYIANMKRILPERIFNISILNIRQKRQSDGFYPAFEAGKHTYVVETADVVDNLRTVIKPTPKNRIRNTYETWDFKKLQEHTSHLDLDIDLKQGLHIAFDYNANINWVVTGQRVETAGFRKLRILSSMFVKAPKDLRNLCREWSDYYKPHQAYNRNVSFYYNQTAKQRKYANGGINEKFHETIYRELTALGWNVAAIDMGETMLHNDKFFMFIDVFKEVIDPLQMQQKYCFVEINKENNEYLIATLENTGRKKGYNGVEKDKSEEKKSDTEDNPSELRTDGTDAFDDLFIGINSHYREGATLMPGISFR